MNDLQSLFSNVLTGPWNQQDAYNAAASQQYGGQAQAAYGSLQSLYAASACVPVGDPESVRQSEIKANNVRNYARWQARIARDPLTDCEAR